PTGRATAAAADLGSPTLPAPVPTIARLPAETKAGGLGGPSGRPLAAHGARRRTILFENGVVERIGNAAVLVVAVEHADELLADADLGGRAPLARRVDNDVVVPEGLAQVILHPGYLVRRHSPSSGRPPAGVIPGSHPRSSRPTPGSAPNMRS